MLDEKVYLMLCCLESEDATYKMFNSNAVQEIIQTSKNGEFADHVEIKLSWILEAPGCNPVVERITVSRSFSQIFEVEPNHCVV